PPEPDRHRAAHCVQDQKEEMRCGPRVRSRKEVAVRLHGDKSDLEYRNQANSTEPAKHRERDGWRTVLPAHLREHRVFLCCLPTIAAFSAAKALPLALSCRPSPSSSKA